MSKALIVAALLLTLVAGLAVQGYAAVEMYEVKATTYVPAFIDYRLNCAADVTIAIRPSTADGTPTGPPIRTVSFTGQSRGLHRYIWLGDNDDGTDAIPNTYYVAELWAASNQPYWDAIIGLYLNSDWTHEYDTHPLPSVPDTEGFYGVAVNIFPATGKYYGRIYATHKVQKDVFMYGPDGAYLGKFNDSAVAWGTSAPWDISVADDGYVYVCDRSNMVIHCFDPDGNYVSTSPPTTNHRAIFARTTSDGKTHILYSGSNVLRKIWVAADHVTWQSTPPGGDTLLTGAGTNNYGMWTNSDISTIYLASVTGAAPGNSVSKWAKSGASWVQDPAFARGITSAVDVSCVDAATDFLWVTRMVPYAEDDPFTTQNETSRALYKTNANTNGVMSYLPHDVVNFGLMNCNDAVGNVAVTFGKSTASWAQRYWALFAEVGTSTCSTKRTGAFRYDPHLAPVVVPNSAVWTPDNTIAANDTDTASVSFKVVDVNGWQDITRVTLDLIPLGYGVVECTLAPDPSDPNGKTVIATRTGIKAKPGARCSTSYGQPIHNLRATPYDSAGGWMQDNSTVNINVSGDPVLLDAYVKHLRLTSWAIDGAQVQAVGGGIPGATDPRAKGPFVYLSAPTTTAGRTSLQLSAGTFQVVAKKTGFGSGPPTNVAVPYTGGTMTLYLRPLTIVEARTIGNGTKVNIEGVCYAQPQGFAPTAANGLAPRTDTLIKRNQFYLCDSWDPANGMLFMVTATSDAFPLTWDDQEAVDVFGNPLYIGKRPAVGESILLTGMLDTPAGYERRVLIQDSDLINGMTTFTVDRTYLNRGNIGGLPTSQVLMPLSGFAHANTAGFSESWGKYIKTTGATVIGYQADGTESGIGMTDPVPYLTIVDMSGQAAQVAVDMPSSLGVTSIPAIGSVYTFTGAASRRTRYGQGCIHVRGQADMVKEADPPIPPAQLNDVHYADVGDSINVSGIVTAKIAASMWITAADRSAGIRVKANPAYVATGDAVQVVGTLVSENGERVIVPTRAIIPISSGNAVPGALDMRTREVGGGPSGSYSGVTGGRGALNVGLKVRVSGMVTAIDANNAYYYIWDGANGNDAPVADGTGSIGVRIQAAPPAGVAPWRDWVDVTGMVGANNSIVPGATIPVIIPISASKVTAFDTVTAPSGTALTAEWNLIGLPAAPAGMSDGNEYSAKPWDAAQVLSPTKGSADIDCRLYRWENSTQSLYIWDAWADEGTHGPFGGILLGDGYWLQIDAPWAVAYSGKSSALDQWIGLPKAGWAIVGHPKDHSTYFADLKIHDGSHTVSFRDAVSTANGWVDCTVYWWDNQTQGLLDAGLPDCFASSQALIPWHGYWVQTYRDNLSLIVPESPAAP